MARVEQKISSIFAETALTALLVSGPAGFLIRHDGIRVALRERQATMNADDTSTFSHPGAAHGTKSAFRARFGRTLWRGLHAMADQWPCRRCQPFMVTWMQGLHDAVNARLGKPAFRAESFARYSSGTLEGGFHRGCVFCRVARDGARLLARAPRLPRPTRSLH